MKVWSYLYTIVTFGMTSPTQYYYSNILDKLFDENEKVTTVEEFWDVSKVSLESLL